MGVEKQRCAWVSEDPFYIAYHDKEWGKPLKNDKKLFELLSLEGMQAGLSWITILKKRQHMREVFFNFEPEKLANLTDKALKAYLDDPGIIRNRLKLSALRSNAQAYLEMQKEHKRAFSNFLWQFVGGTPRLNVWKTAKEVPAETRCSQEMSKALKKRGFRFVGPTICYAFMQSAGMVNDHTKDCYLFAKTTLPTE